MYASVTVAITVMASVFDIYIYIHICIYIHIYIDGCVSIMNLSKCTQHECSAAPRDSHNRNTPESHALESMSLAPQDTTLEHHDFPPLA